MSEYSEECIDGSIGSRTREKFPLDRQLDDFLVRRQEVTFVIFDRLVGPHDRMDVPQGAVEQRAIGRVVRIVTHLLGTGDVPS